MPSDAQALLLQVSADTSKAVKSLDALNRKLSGVANTAATSSKRAGADLDRFFGRGTKGATEMGRAIGNIKTATLQQLAPGVDRYATALSHLGVAGVAAGVAIAGVVAAFAQAREAVRFADELADTADRLHVTTDALQEYRFAIRAAGGEEKGADEALESFSETLGKAQQGLPKAQRGFLALGFTKAQIEGFEDVETTLPKISAALVGLSDAQKDAAVSQLGLEGLKQLLESGPDAMERFLRSAKAAGVVMDSDLIARSKDLNDEIETATSSATAATSTAKHHDAALRDMDPTPRRARRARVRRMSEPITLAWVDGIFRATWEETERFLIEYGVTAEELAVCQDLYLATVALARVDVVDFLAPKHDPGVR